MRRGLGRLGLGLGLGLSLVCAPTWLWAETGAGLLGGHDVSAWLDKTRSAALNRNFSGTLTYTVGGVVSNSRVTHFCEGEDRYERIEVMDGQARVRYGHNDRVLTVWPASRTAVVETAVGPRGFPRLPDGGAKVAELYAVKSVAQDRLAGRDAAVYLFTPKDRLRFAQRIWTDRESGMMLREDILSPTGQVLESSAFSDLSLLARAEPGPVIRAMAQLEHLRVVQAGAQRTHLEAEGWRVVNQVPGFDLVHCSKRPLDASAEGPGVEVLQSVFSDGIAQVSVFIEPFDARRHKQPLRTVLGATHTSMVRNGHWWVTVVGEVPMETVTRFETTLDRRP